MVIAQRRDKGTMRDGSTGFSPVWVRIWVRRSAWRWNLRLDHKNDTDRDQHSIQLRHTITTPAIACQAPHPEAPVPMRRLGPRS